MFAAAMTYFLFKVLAATGPATLYTSPSGSQSAYVGQSFAVTVRISTGGNVPVTGASVYMSYPADKLKLVSESYGGPYNTQLAASDSNGVLRMDRAAFPAISGGDKLFAKVTFKAKASGSAPISFTGSSIVTSGEDDSNILGQKNGVTYKLSEQPASSPPGSDGGSSGSGSGGSSSGGSSQGTGGGSSGSHGSSGGSSDRHHKKHHKKHGRSGSRRTHKDSSSKGTERNTTSVKIAVLDSDKKPVRGAEVTVDGQSSETDKHGIAYFSGIPAGDQSITVRYNGKETSKELHVSNASSTQTPQLVKVSIPGRNFSPLLLFVPTFVLLVIGLFVVRPWDRWFMPLFAKDETPAKVVSSDHPATPPSEPLFTPPKVSQQKKDEPGTVYEPGGSDKDKPPNNG